MADDRTPAVSLEPTSVVMMRQLAALARDYAKDQKRIRHLVTFQHRDIKNEQGDITKIRYRSKVQPYDRPEVELYLEYRDMVLKADADIEKVEKFLEANMTPEERIAAFESLARLRGQRQQHMQAMVNVLGMLHREFGAKESIISKITTDVAKMAAAAKINDDRLDVMRKRIGDEPTDAEIERVANEEG